ncbi:MAG: glycosyltransferase [Oscillospiraceae bacterium]|nr:glycosyltransferase [Oscillospiraceae bacterium]
MDLISVIVPVYKVEPYLDRCIRSIVDQTYRNLEIILVDDGSPDRCGEMCDAWAAKDSRIRVIHKENGGAGLARNIAMDLAHGEFISLIDSDDYIEPHMYEHLLSLMVEDVDIAECELLETESDDAPLDGPKTDGILVCTAEEAMAHHIGDAIFRQTPPNKLYRRATVGDIRFPVGNRIDDEFFTYRVIARCRRLAHSDRRMYAYRQQPGSVMHLSFALSRLQAVDAKEQRLELLEQQFPELVPLAKTNLWYTCLYQGQMALRHLNETDRRTAFGKLKSALDRHPLTSADRKTLPLKQQVWHHLTGASFILACRLRNLLKIGI